MSTQPKPEQSARQEIDAKLTESGTRAEQRQQPDEEIEDKSSTQRVLNSVTLNEAQTRALQIDPQLRAADWKLNDRTQVRLEVPVDGYDAEPWNGVTDYCLYDASGNVLAVVEAK